MENDKPSHPSSGENPGLDMRRSMARYANKRLKQSSGEGSSPVINLGEEHGEISTKHVRFRDSVKEGHLTAYIRQEASDPKVIIPTVIALGIVAAGVYKLKHRKK